jgi:hypothetical protein
MTSMREWLKGIIWICLIELVSVVFPSVNGKNLIVDKLNSNFFFVFFGVTDTDNNLGKNWKKNRLKGAFWYTFE